MSSLLESKDLEELTESLPAKVKKSKKEKISLKEGRIEAVVAKKPLSPFMLYCGERRAQLK